jgi:putative FmdB family regulatory protein
MPTYDYICSACDHHVEIFQKITDDPVKKCPACKKSKLVRQFGTGGAIVFKGSGFYQTDYRSEGYRKAAESDKPATAPAAESKSDKPSTGPEKPATASSEATPRESSSGKGRKKKTD